MGLLARCTLAFLCVAVSVCSGKGVNVFTDGGLKPDAMADIASPADQAGDSLEAAGSADVRVSVGSGGAPPGTGGAGGRLTNPPGTGRGGNAGTTTGTGGGSAGNSGASVEDAGPVVACTTDMASLVRISEIDMGSTVVANEDEASLMAIALSPIAGGGARLAWMGNDSQVHLAQLDGSDRITGASAAVPAHDFADLYADDKGAVLLLTRDAKGDGNLNCGTLTNLCGATSSLPGTSACYDMYMVRVDGTAETWATQLTQSSAAHPPYLSSPTDNQNEIYIWWYAHHGRIAFDGSRWAGYYGAAISISQACVDANSALKTAVNIHQGDSMQIVDAAGKIQSGGFDWGCSHSGYERVLWDPSNLKFVTVCKNDAATSGKSGKVALAPRATAIYPVDLSYSNMSNVVLGTTGGYWLAVSDMRPGQTAGANGLADVHLIHFTTGTSDKDILLANDAGLNVRAPHLAAYGNGKLLAAWETSSKSGDLTANDTGRKLIIQILDAATGAALSTPYNVTGIKGNRYYELRSFPDGSVAYPAPGSTGSKIKILRVSPCD
jgi:hypothetical protein